MQLAKPIKTPRKQRKQLYTASAHLCHKFMAAPLSQELAASRGVKALPVRKGDTVQVMRGDHKGFEGKISHVDLKHRCIFVEGLTREKVDGTTIFIPIHPSKVMIKNLKLDDKLRQAVVERKKQARPKKEMAPKKVEKLPEQIEMDTAEKIVKEQEVAAVPRQALAENASEYKEVWKPDSEENAKKETSAEEKAPIKKKKATAKSKAKSVEKEEKADKLKKVVAKRKSVAANKEGGT